MRYIAHDAHAPDLPAFHHHRRSRCKIRAFICQYDLGGLVLGRRAFQQCQQGSSFTTCSVFLPISLVGLGLTGQPQRRGGQQKTVAMIGHQHRVWRRVEDISIRRYASTVETNAHSPPPTPPDQPVWSQSGYPTREHARLFKASPHYSSVIFMAQCHSQQSQWLRQNGSRLNSRERQVLANDAPDSRQCGDLVIRWA